MKKIVCENYDALSAAAADFVANEIKGKAEFVLGLPTGSTPVGMYEKLSRMSADAMLDFSATTFFNLDEYYPIQKTHCQSYAHFMQKNLFENIKVNPDKINIPCGEAQYPEQETQLYDQKISKAGGIDLMVLGVGVNGHIGFNEPGDELEYATHLTSLTQSTVKANSRFFDSEAQVPKQALTMGIGPILAAKKILVLVSGANKRDAVEKMFSGKITTQCPATLLSLHGDVTVLVDRDADGGK